MYPLKNTLVLKRTYFLELEVRETRGRSGRYGFQSISVRTGSTLFHFLQMNLIPWSQVLFWKGWPRMIPLPRVWYDSSWRKVSFSVQRGRRPWKLFQPFSSCPKIIIITRGRPHIISLYFLREEHSGFSGSNLTLPVDRSSIWAFTYSDCYG